jgi:hypothetical protein
MQFLALDLAHVLLSIEKMQKLKGLLNVRWVLMSGNKLKRLNSQSMQL